MWGVALGVVLGASTLLSIWLPVAIAALLAGCTILVSRPLRPVRLLHVLVVVTPFTAAMPRGQLIPFLTINDALVVVSLVVVAVYALLAHRGGTLPRPLLIALAAFVLGTSIGPVLLYTARGDTLGFEDTFSLLSPLKFVLVFWIFSIVPKTASERAGLIRSMVLSAAMVAAIGLLQAANVGPVVDLINAVYPSDQVAQSMNAGRVTSVIGAWNSLGLFLLTALLIIAATIVDQPTPRRRNLMSVAAAVILVCLLATNLYSGILGAALGLVLIKTADPRGLRSLVPLVFVALVGAVLLLPTIVHRAEMQFDEQSWVPQTLRFRYDVWTRYFIPDITKQPIIGVRPSFEGIPFPYPESQYVYLLYRSGLVSLLGHIVWIVGTLVWLATAIRRARPGPEGAAARSLALIPIVLILVSSLIGAINPVFTYTASMTYFWMILGLVLSSQNGA